MARQALQHQLCVYLKQAMTTLPDGKQKMAPCSQVHMIVADLGQGRQCKNVPSSARLQILRFLHNTSVLSCPGGGT